MTKPAKSEPREQEPDGPAVVTELHELRRPATDDRGREVIGKVAWSKRTTLELYFDQGRLAGGNAKYSDLTRLAAGQAYAKLWDTAQSSGRDSTQALNVSHGGSGLPLTQAQSEAIRGLVAVESHLGQRDRIICRMVCGQGHFPSEAVKLVCGDYKDTVAARFRESLDALIEAFEAMRKAPERVSMERRA